MGWIIQDLICSKGKKFFRSPKRLQLLWGSRALSLGVMWPVREAYSSPPSSAKCKCTYHLSTCLHGADRDNMSFYPTRLFNQGSLLFQLFVSKPISMDKIEHLTT